MSSTLLEVLRLNHALSDRAELAIGQVLEVKPNGQKAKVWQQHRLMGIADQIVQFNTELEQQYEDRDNLLREELARIRDGGLATFDEALQSTLEYYEKFPGLQAVEAALPEAPVRAEFSGEEVFGKYLDLNGPFSAFCNLMKKADIEQDYLQYLERFSTFFYIPEELKASHGYLVYLQCLWGYLRGFYVRSHPLEGLDQAVADWEAEFRQKVATGEICVRQRAERAQEPQALRLGMFHELSELEALGMERLKEALEALGLKCGGTLQDRALRLWAVRGKKPEEIPAALKVKPKTRAGAAGAGATDGAEAGASHSEQVAWLEFRITSLCEVLGDTVSATRRHAEKQQTRSVSEKLAEIREEEFGLLPDAEDKAGAEEDDDEAPIYNPLNLPLGWDGKPIPYWLYKLHGLGVEYKCEVCGNQSYWGRKAFDRHFHEWKHAYGMRCLGVPNTKHFHDVTKIDDVLALYGKIKDQLRREQYVQDAEEEFEDTQGNVLNKRTYEDLARQGLL